MSEMLHDRLSEAANRTGSSEPVNTSAVYTAALHQDPDLLDQLLLVHHRVQQEQGEIVPDQAPPDQADDGERKRMLSAVRATVRQSAARYET